MSKRDSRYDILFEPIQIGPVKMKNRFYVAPHADSFGMGKMDEMIAYRKARAEGGWGAVCTGETMIHETSDHAPFVCTRLSSDKFIEPMSRLTGAIHEQGSLAGVELAHVGASCPSWSYRQHPISPSAQFPRLYNNPVSARKMDRKDIAELRHWYKKAAKRAQRAGFDIIYAYCSHDLSILQDFLMQRTNKRTDEYGGVFENRLRLVKEVLSDLKDTVGDTCAIALRFSVEDRQQPSSLNIQEDGRRVVESLAEIPDLWDVNVSDWAWDSGSSRFFEEGAQEPFISFVKQVTNKPVVGVGRFTSPDAMVSQIKRGVLDIIGAARPSIADPFLPNKIDTGKTDDIRECIGCNICTAEVMNNTAIRCTQNPSVGEEHRKGWHPEKVPPAHDESKSILIIGGGPSGLEAALTLGKRGYQVSLVDGGKEWGGRLVRERRMPRLSAWGRVVDYRLELLQVMPNVQMYLDSPLTAEDVEEFEADHVIVATGSAWRSDGTGRSHSDPIPGWDQAHVYSPENILNGEILEGDVVVYDDDYYYMASIIVDKLVSAGLKVTYVTSASIPAPWTINTLEFGHIVKSMNDSGVEIVTDTNISSINEATVRVVRQLTGKESQISAKGVVLVSGQLANDSLYYELQNKQENGLITSLERIGDCISPALIAQSTHDGRLAGMTYGQPDSGQD
ncbi:FAD-dependent oxidoreductase [Dasania marina]|uniref:oxidoreductase n=1 Tax=Dasania marina TaxID=471499 RepID=UPI0030D7E314|tara:strand:+ start:8853 stop:10883 length:2031 start_codon:yes stop_codon:yes gene_type:complete